MEFDCELKAFESNELAGYLNPAGVTLQPEFPCRLNQLYIESVISYKNSLNKIKTTNLIPSFNYFIKNYDQNNDKNANDLKGNEINVTKNVIIDLKNNFESNASSNANRIIHPVSSKYKYRRDRFSSEPNLISNRNKTTNTTNSTKQSQKSSTYSILPRALFKQFSFCNKPQHSSTKSEKKTLHKYLSKSLDNIMKNEKKSYKKRSRSTSKTGDLSEIKPIESRTTARKSIILNSLNIFANSTEALSLLDQKSGSCSSVSANSLGNKLPKSNSCSSLVILKENFKNKEVLDQRMIQDHNEILNLTKKETKPNTNGAKNAFKTFNIKKAISNLYRSRSRAVSNGKETKKKKTNTSANHASRSRDTQTPKHSITSKKSLINMYFFKKSSQSSTKSNSLANMGFFSNSRRSTSSTSARFITNSIDLRSYSEKKSELNDIVLNLFINSDKCAHRRNAVCTKIDKLYYDRQLVNYMEYLLREDYIKNFLL